MVQTVRIEAEARGRAEETWRLLLIATQRREALERLRRRQRLLHTSQAAREEQKVLDEMSGRGPRLAEAWRKSAANT